MKNTKKHYRLNKVKFTTFLMKVVAVVYCAVFAFYTIPEFMGSVTAETREAAITALHSNNLAIVVSTIVFGTFFVTLFVMNRVYKNKAV